MGGKALKEVETRRYERDEYLELEREVLDKVSSFLPDDIRCEAIKAYHTKPSFGDMDIVIEHISSKEHIEELFKQWGVKEVSKNSNCWSTHYNDFQVDFIFVEQEYYQSTLDYFAYNDIGNLLGRISRRFDFKLGHRGLNYMLMDKTSLLKDINVTNDYQEALEFIGYDYERFKRGFDTLEEMFEYVIDNKNFDPSVFALENRNHDARMRDAKRPNYNKFLKFIEGKEFPHVMPINKEQAYQRACETFPEFEAEVKQVKHDLKIKKMVKQKFNGLTISEITGFKGTELGLFYKFVNKESAKIQDFDDFVLRSTDEELDLFTKVVKSRFDKDVGFHSFIYEKSMMKYLKEELGCSTNQLKKIGRSFETKNMMKYSVTEGQPLGLVPNGTAYIYNANTYSAMLKSEYGIDISSKSLSLVSCGLDRFKRFDIIESEKQIPSVIQSLEDTRMRVKEKENIQKEKKKKKERNNRFVNKINEVLEDSGKKDFACIDIEMYEKDHSKLTEVGITYFDKKGNIQTEHYLVQENLDFRNGEYVPDNRDNFNFGETKVAPLEEIVQIAKERLTDAKFIVGNVVQEDLKHLFSKQELDKFREKCVDTSAMLSRIDNTHEDAKKERVNILRMCQYLNIKAENLHNAGNDSRCNFMALDKVIDIYQGKIKHKSKQKP